ncbi:MAG TPA: hypothetical protein VGS19_06285 [Streptosporangiaceae bacterium]|nr:hypothetical protein [Streptosporangiaceae bacterium]
MSVAFPSRLRWAVPAVAVVAVAATVAGTVIGVAQAAPPLPGRTPGQLIVALANSSPPPLTGTVVETTSLGLPQLPGSMQPSSLTSLLAGSHTVKVWYGGPGQIRLAVPVQMGETDLIQNKDTVWLWQSGSNSVTKAVLPRETGRNPAPEPKVRLMPQQAAQQALALVGKTTRVSTEANVDVAGQAAYQLVVAPKDGRSLVGRVTIAIDGQHPAVVLRVQVFARGARNPAFQVGYTNVNFVRPAAANFSFTPPRGAHVSTISPGECLAASVPPAAIRQAIVRSAQLHGLPAAKAMPMMPRMVVLPKGASLPKGLKLPKGVHIVYASKVSGPRSVSVILNGAAGAAAKSAVARQVHVMPMPAVPMRGGLGCGAPTGWVGASPIPPMGFSTAPQVIGQGWTTVVALPSSVLGGIGGVGAVARGIGQSARSAAGNGQAQVGGDAILAALVASAKAVHGSWGSGRLISTSLLSVLITSNGHVLLGAVQPSVLYSAAAHVK